MGKIQGRILAVLTIGSFLLVLAAIHASRAVIAKPLGPVVRACPPCERLVNPYLRADISPVGAWVLGTTGGDPDTPLDDGKSLLYGFSAAGGSTVGSGYTTIRVVGRAQTFDVVPHAAVRQRATGDEVATVWTTAPLYGIVVTQTLRLVDNPFSGRQDAALVRYEVRNVDTQTLSVGLRTLLDVKLGYNDGAPYFVPGVGAISTETQFVGSDVPAFWVAFESPTYDPRMLRAVGVLRGYGVTAPDRFVIADWVRIQTNDWTYEVQPTAPVTKDSAVALYWNPTALAPGETRQLSAMYGTASLKGGSAFLTAPIQAQCGTTVTVAMFVNNFDVTPLTGGEARIELPSGIELASGETATKVVGEIRPGGTGSAQWQLAIGADTSGPIQLRAVATFDDDKQFEAAATVGVECAQPTPTETATATVTPMATLPITPTITVTATSTLTPTVELTPTPIVTPTATVAPTATVTPTATALPTARPTASPLPTPSATPFDHAPRVCPFILSRVPAAVIARALDQPHLIFGWNQLANPAAPESPYNQRRRWLSLANFARPFHPVHNSVVYKAGCP